MSNYVRLAPDVLGDVLRHQARALAKTAKYISLLIKYKIDSLPQNIDPSHTTLTGGKGSIFCGSESIFLK